MSDTPLGEGWWQASDGKWYSPEQSPGAAAAGGVPPARPQLDVGLAIGYGWAKFTENLGSMILIVLIVFGVTALFTLFANVIRIGEGITAGLFSIALFAVGIFVGLLVEAGLVRTALRVTTGAAPDPAQMFSTERLGPYVIAAILVSLLSFVGFFACCIGYLVVRVFALFFGFFVLDPDRRAEPADSIKRSFDLVSGNPGGVVLFAVVVVLLNLVTCGLALGVTELATGYAYRQLNGDPIA